MGAGRQRHRHSRRAAGVRLFAALLVLLAASPVTAPFSSCNLSALLAAPAGSAPVARPTGTAVKPVAELVPPHLILSMVTEDPSKDDVTLSKPRGLTPPRVSVQAIVKAPVGVSTTRTTSTVLRL
jgi:hypothetical protein